MNLSLDLLAKYFDEAFKYDIAVKIKNKIFDLFRKPYVKNDMTTHGPLWNQYALPAGIIPSGDIYIDMNTKGFILVEGKKKNVRVFLSTLGHFLDYLENREDGNIHGDLFC